MNEYDIDREINDMKHLYNQNAVFSKDESGLPGFIKIIRQDDYTEHCAGPLAASRTRGRATNSIRISPLLQNNNETPAWSKNPTILAEGLHRLNPNNPPSQPNNPATRREELMDERAREAIDRYLFMKSSILYDNEAG